MQLRLHGIPEAISAAVCTFADLEGAVDTVIATIQCGMPVARIELLDELQMRAVNAYSKLDYPEAPTLFFEFHGTPAWVEEQAEMVGEIADGNGGGDFRWATQPEDRNRLWQARHDAYYAAKALRPGAEAAPPTSACRSRGSPNASSRPAPTPTANGLLAPIVGHVGDGNFHVIFLLDPDRPGRVRRAEAINDRLVERALAMGGTCTGEHGIGLGKIALPRAGARRGRRPDARDQARPRPAEHPQPRQDLRPRSRRVTAPRWTQRRHSTIVSVLRPDFVLNVWSTRSLCPGFC